MKNFQFIVLKKKNILIAGVLLLVCLVIFFTKDYAYNVFNHRKYVVVIDAGHGGRDCGAIGKESGIMESELTLQFANTLKAICENFGFDVVMTRTDMSGLYDEDSKNKKKNDMEQRKKIINNAKPDLIISLHMNSSDLEYPCGAQVYYGKEDEKDKLLADDIQNTLKENVKNAKKQALYGDFFILNCTKYPSALIECGFLSNPAEEKLLISKQYQEDFCYNILCGILRFLS